MNFIFNDCKRYSFNSLYLFFVFKSVLMKKEESPCVVAALLKDFKIELIDEKFLDKRKK